MPIIIKDHKWRQTEQLVTIRVPLHGVPKTKVDLLTSEQYVKASFEQFLFELFPTNSISPEDSKCTIHEKEIIYELAKSQHTLWDTLEQQLTKQEKAKLRSEALNSISEKLTAEHEMKLTRQDELKRCAVSEAVGIDTKQRNTIEKIRTEEKLRALGDTYAWNKEMKKAKALCGNGVVRQRYKNYVDKSDEASVPVPLARGSSTLEVEFTPRVLPTPSRESQLAEETEWLTKQSEALRSAGFVSDDLRPEERNPHYLLSKGDDFLRNENYLAAISAYTFGIKMSPNCVDLYIKRSEAQVKLGNFHKCAEDCSTALELMKPEVPSNLLQRAACIGRRGIALYKLGLKQQAIDELRASVKLKHSEEYAEFLETILSEPIIESETQADCGFDLFK